MWKAKDLKRKTGFKDVETLLAYVIVVCATVTLICCKIGVRFRLGSKNGCFIFDFINILDRGYRGKCGKPKM